MGFKFRGIPSLITPGRPFQIDMERAGRDALQGVFYTSDIQGMMRVLIHDGYEFSISGSPTKGIRQLDGIGWRIICLYKAWLYEEGTPAGDVYEDLEEYKGILDDKMSFTAAKSFAKLFGKMKWLDEDLRPWARAAYSGGIQWSRPGVYLHTITSDMTEAYYWAMHHEPLPYRWTMDYTSVKFGKMCIVCATITTKGGSMLPLLPISNGYRRTQFVMGEASQTVHGYWHSADLIAARDQIAKMEVHWIARGHPSWTLPKRQDMSGFPKKLRKRLALVGYGIHAQAGGKWIGVYAKNFYDACRKHGSHKIRQTIRLGEGGEGIWWRYEHDDRPYVRIDWGGIVTARVRQRMIQEAGSIMARGGEVARIYVDSVTGTIPLVNGYDAKRPGHFKKESEGFAVIGPPGICLIDGQLKRSGVPIDRALSILDRVRHGTLPNRYELDVNWTGIHEDMGE